MTENKKILFLQFRGPIVKPKEQERILALAKKPRADFEFKNFFEEDLSELDTTKYSHIIMGGGSDYNITEKPQPWFEDVKRIILQAEKYSIPLLGLCYGMQFIAWSFGARIVADKNMAGAGSEEITMQNKQGSFFEFLPDKFLSNMIHNDSVTDLPPKLECYGYTQKCPIAIIGHQDKPIYGTQFHSELTKSYVKFVLDNVYAGKYGDLSENDKIASSIVEPSGLVAEIIPRFLKV